VGLAVQGVANEKKKLFIHPFDRHRDFHGKFCCPYDAWVFRHPRVAVGTGRKSSSRRHQLVFLTADNAFRLFARERRLPT